MRITSLEIKQHEFERAFRGYNVEEVNHFLSNLADEWDRMLNEIKMLKMQLDIAEKDASKLREIESTLIKTLRTAEDTSSKIKESANLEATKKIDEATFEASRKLHEANQKADQIIKDAENNSRQMLSEAEAKVKGIQEAAEAEFAELDIKYNSLESRKNALINQLKSYNQDLSQLIGNNESKTELKVETFSEPIKEKEELKVVEKTVDFFEETKPTPIVEEPIVEEPIVEDPIVEEETEDFSSGVNYSSAVNKINAESVLEAADDLEIVEGIGPKIKELLQNSGIRTFRDLATTPEYRLKDILAAAGTHYAAHDPGTWNEQALLAANGEWDKLDELKDKLVAGKVPVKEEVVNLDGSNTEEMLDKVNKVKAAIRKAMVEKTDSAKPEQQSQSGSFFDSI